MKLYRYIALRPLFCTLFIIHCYCLFAHNPSLPFQDREKEADSLQLEEKHHEAIEIYKSILQNIEPSSANHQKYRLQIKIGNSLIHSGQDLKARPWFSKVINAGNSVIDEGLISDAMTGLGSIYEYTGKRDSAFFWYLKAYHLVNESADTLRIARGARNIAQLLRVLKRFDEANVYCRQAVNLIPGIGDYKVAANIFNETAYLFELSEQYDSAAYYYNRLIDISVNNNYLKGESVGYNNLASVYEKTNRHKDVLDMKFKGLEIDRRLDDTHGIMTSLISLAESYLALNNNSQAYKALDEAFALCDTSWIVDLSGIHYLYYKLFKKTGRLADAMTHYEKHISLRDSINHNKSLENVMDLLAQYETEKKEQQILLLEQSNLIKENKIHLQWMLIGVLVLSGLLIIVTGWTWGRHKTQKIKQMQVEIQQFLLQQKDKKKPDKSDLQNDPAESLKKLGLTTREGEILHHLSQGCSNAKIAEKLFISENTVKFHIKNIYIKLNVNNRMEAVLRCSEY